MNDKKFNIETEKEDNNSKRLEKHTPKGDKSYGGDQTHEVENEEDNKIAKRLIKYRAVGNTSNGHGTKPDNENTYLINVKKDN